MSNINLIFERLENIINNENILKEIHNENKNIQPIDGNHDIYNFLQHILTDIDALSFEIKTNENILISVKNQKILRTCFQVITSFGILNCLIPGLGVDISKHSTLAQSIPNLTLNDEQKYKLLKLCIDFFQRSYSTPVLKNIIITFHLSDYLAALIQLAFAPLKKPGNYQNFIMTEDRYAELSLERHKYVDIYENLVDNCFQPKLMKELIIMQNISHVKPPPFVKRIVSKELSRRLTNQGGLLSLIRCFLDCNFMDIGVEWKKVNMICKIVSVKHGEATLDEYLCNICRQLRNILTINNSQYITTAVSCILSLVEAYPDNEPVKTLFTDTVVPFNYDVLVTQCTTPGTILLTVQEVEHSILILHACTCVANLELPIEMISKNMYILNQLYMKCSKDNIKSKIQDIILKILEMLDDHSTFIIVKELLCGKIILSIDISIEEYNSGILLKSTRNPINNSSDEVVSHFLHLFNAVSNTKVIENLFQSLLKLLLELKLKRHNQFSESQIKEDILNHDDKIYANILLILSEISAMSKTVNVFKKSNLILHFVEKLLADYNNSQKDDECVTIALVLLNSILTNRNKNEALHKTLMTLLPTLTKIMKDSNEYNNILCKEIIKVTRNEYPQKEETAYGKALSNIYDNLLPVRAHGVKELTKLIDAKDPETLSKRHYVFCLLQECLQDSDSYLYLSAINGIASLSYHCTDDVLSVLCKEFLHMSPQKHLETSTEQNKTAEMKMKIGDIIVKLTRNLGEMAIVHKTVLLNTFMCACRDEDPLIRASALSNLAEIALVLHYRIGSIIYEILLCIWNIIESDKAVECRRAAVMVINSLIKGLGTETLLELKDELLPIYKTLNRLYKDENEDKIVRLHAQLGLEELNDIVKQFLCPSLPMERDVLNINKRDIIFK